MELVLSLLRMTCPYCGKRIPVNSSRCPECRAVLPAESGQDELAKVFKLSAIIALIVFAGLILLIYSLF